MLVCTYMTFWLIVWLKEEFKVFTFIINTGVLADGISWNDIWITYPNFDDGSFGNGKTCEQRVSIVWNAGKTCKNKKCDNKNEPSHESDLILKCFDNFGELNYSEAARLDIIQRNPLWEPFVLYELTEIMRQKGEYQFCKALNNMAEGQMDIEDIKLIRKREINDMLQPPPGAVWLFESSKQCERFNNQVHKALNTESAISNAVDKIEGKITLKILQLLLFWLINNNIQSKNVLILNL